MTCVIERSALADVEAAFKEKQNQSGHTRGPLVMAEGLGEEQLGLRKDDDPAAGVSKTPLLKAGDWQS